MLWITNEHENFQQRSDRLSVELADRGFTSEKVYPSSEEESNEAHRETLRDAFDRGQLLVHFFGHGGRYIWRTGPPDLKKNHDLFGLEDLDMLQSSDRLPIVLSMTCYSAPFDHPNADSIGEKFLRLEDRGAVAVVAAAWRNAPTFEMSAQLIAAMTRPGTIGEAFQASKTNANYPAYQDQYNLLGDPALPIALPRYELALELPAAAVPRVVAELPSETTAGKVVVDWIGFEGQILHSQFLTEVGSQLDVTYDGDRALFETVSHVRVYFWDATTGVDALAAVPVRSEEPIAGADTPPTTGGPSGGAP